MGKTYQIVMIRYAKKTHAVGPTKTSDQGIPPPLYKVLNGEAFTKLKGTPFTDQIPKEAFGGHPFHNHTEYDEATLGMESLSGTSKIGSAAGSTPTSARLALRWSLKL